MDPLLAKAEPLSNGGSTSVMIYLRRGKEQLCNSSWETGVRIQERNNSADTQISEGGQDVLQVLEQRFPCSLCCRPW